MKSKPLILCLALVLLSDALALAQETTFTRISYGAIVNDGGNSYGCAWGDYDNDGDLDLFVANTGNQNNFLYQNNGDGTFAAITTGAIVNDGGNSYGCAWGDYDNDGDLDLFVANSGNDFLYQNNGDGSFTKITSGAIVNNGGNSSGSAWGDYDNDGDLDLFVSNYSENNFLYQNNGDGTFTAITTGAIVTDGGISSGCAWGDYDNDGDLDLFVANSGNNFLYQNNGDGSFTRITSGAIVNDGGDSRGCSWGDYDNDGDLDLIVTNSGNNFLYQNHGDGTFTQITTGAIVNDGGNSYGCAWGDYDSDGDLDLFIGNSGNNFLYQNHGDGSFIKITSGVIVNNGGYSRGCAWGDYDNDGDLDLFVANDRDENNFLYKNTGSSNNWINIRLVGTLSNTSAIGTKVRIKATIGGVPVWQIGEISGQTGAYSQNSLNVEFGLSDATLIDSIRVEWPSNIVQDMTDVVVNQFLILTELPFTRITNDVIVSDRGTPSGCAWGDYNNDGDLDLFVANYSDAPFDNDFLYQNNGDGSFTKITDGAIVNNRGYSSGCAWGDYDNDGDLDLFVAKSGGENNFLYQNNGDGSFTRITDGVIVNDRGNSFGCAWGDYDNDGEVDLFVAKRGGENNRLYQNNGDGGFTRITSGAIVNDGGDSQGCSWGDYDNDGDLDLFVTNSGNNFLYQNDGDGSFTKITTGAVVDDGGNSYGCAWGDYDNDGDLDLFVANSGNDFLYQNNGDGTFTKIVSGVIVNNDGYSQGCAWGDYDNDGDLDLFVAKSSDTHTQNNFLYQNHGNHNSWINLHLVGTASNTSAIGARVRVKARIKGTTQSSGWQMQEISGQTGYLSQNSLNAEFGLGRATIIDSIQIQWPSHIVNYYANVAINRFLTLRENRRPSVLNTISDTTLSHDHPKVLLNLNASFIDPDKDVLTYTAVSNNAQIAAPSIAGNILTVTLVSDTAMGRAQITVKAEDGGADDGRENIVETSFQINRPPFVLNEISHLALLRDDRFVTELKKIFIDPEGDSLTYTRNISGDTSAFIALISEGKLFILPEDTGRAVITLQADDGRGGKRSIQINVAVIISPAPVIHHDPVSTRNLNENIPIVAQITDDENALAYAFVNYRIGGAPGLVALRMDTTGARKDSLRAIIPADAVTNRGVEYFIETKDNHNVSSRLPIAPKAFSVRVRVNGEGVKNDRPQPSGGEQKSYHLFSIPLDVDKKSPSEVLIDDLGPYNIKKWRFYDIATDTTTGKVSNIQFPNTGEMAPGKAFWLIVKDSDRFINTGPGTTVLTSESFPISLKKGWNLVGNPFNFPAFADDTLSDHRPLRFFAYEAGKWSDSIKPVNREFQPFEGYAVYCSTACKMFINPHRFSSTDNFLPKVEASPDEEVLWSIRILAQCQEARDGNNVAAVVKQASREYDRIDQPEPPVIGEYVSVYFPHRDWPTLAKTYCLDARPDPAAAGEIWEFEVKTNIRDKVNLSFEGMASVPEELEVWLVDEALKITQNLREQRQYAVAGPVAVAGAVAGGAEHAKQLKLVVGKHDFVDEKLAEVRAIPTTYELSQNFPNPFNPVTTIRYGLPKAERVTLKIYNLLGAEVVTLVDNEPKAAGYHVAIWDGRNKNGGVVASGVYVYRLQAGSLVMAKKMAVVK